MVDKAVICHDEFPDLFEPVFWSHPSQPGKRTEALRS